MYFSIVFVKRIKRRSRQIRAQIYMEMCPLGVKLLEVLPEPSDTVSKHSYM
jgi:hypothetical protein